MMVKFEGKANERLSVAARSLQNGQYAYVEDEAVSSQTDERVLRARRNARRLRIGLMAVAIPLFGGIAVRNVIDGSYLLAAFMGAATARFVYNLVQDLRS
jgi:hypothetical protein